MCPVQFHPLCFPVFNIHRVASMQRCAAAAVGKERRGKTAKQVMTDNNLMALNGPAGTVGCIEGKARHAR